MFGYDWRKNEKKSLKLPGGKLLLSERKIISNLINFHEEYLGLMYYALNYAGKTIENATRIYNF